MTESRRRGQPAFAPTDEQRARAAGLLADGRDQKTVALDLGISEPTFRKAFAAEILADRERRASIVAAAPLLDIAASADIPLPLPPAPTSALAAADSDTRPARIRPVGRPRYQPDHADREQVSLLLADNWKHEDIAAVLSISPPTFAKAFREQIRVGALKKRAALLSRLQAAANRGSVAAMVALQKRFDSAEIDRLGETFAQPMGGEMRPKAETPGKKMLAADAARDVFEDSDWSGLLKPGQSLPPAGNA